ncbi:alpha/beta hydrolase [Shewanella khirikhana]|uniref:alpha/beta fold hydrolase n=1 Tax=Shewanella khirikhana TaxID=1965282 RepID=UPI0030CC7831
MTIAVNELTLALPHIRLAATAYGDADKPLLLALHGWLDNASSFAPLAEVLTNYRLLAIDWPGHGDSEHRPGSYPLHWIDYLYDLHGVLMHLAGEGLRPKAIIGHSLGGIVASAYLASYPDATDALVLIEALGPLTERPGKTRERLARSFDSHWQWATSSANPKVYASFETVIEARHRLTGLDKVACELLLRRNFAATDAGVVSKTDPRLKFDSPMRLTPAHGEAFIRGFALPSLLLMGDSGYEQLKALFELSAPLYQNLTQVQLTGDHHLHMTHPQACAAAINAFLASQAQG